MVMVERADIRQENLASAHASTVEILSGFGINEIVPSVALVYILFILLVDGRLERADAQQNNLGYL